MIPKSTNQRRIYLRAFTIALAVAVSIAIPIWLAIQLRVQVESGFSDFQGFYDAGTAVAEGRGSQLYDSCDQPRLLKGGNTPDLVIRHCYIHAPFEALFFVPLARLPFVEASWFWWSFSLLCAFVTFFINLRFLPWIRERVELGIVTVAIFVPIIATLFQGQDSIVTLLMFAICYASVVRQRYVLAGCSLAIAMYKPPLVLPMILLIAITSERRWKLLAGFFGTLSLLICAAIAAVGWDCVSGYPSLLSSFSARDAGHYHIADMPNVRGLVYFALQHVDSERLTVVIVAALSLVVLAAAIWPTRNMMGRPEADPSVFSLFVTASVLVGYQEYTYDLALLYLPILLTLDTLMGERDNSRDRHLLLGTTMFLLLGSIFALTKPSLYACAILFSFILLARRISRRNARIECAGPVEAVVSN